MKNQDLEVIVYETSPNHVLVTKWIDQKCVYACTMRADKVQPSLRALIDMLTADETPTLVGNSIAAVRKLNESQYETPRVVFRADKPAGRPAKLCTHATAMSHELRQHFGLV